MRKEVKVMLTDEEILAVTAAVSAALAGSSDEEQVQTLGTKARVEAAYEGARRMREALRGGERRAR